MTIRLLLCFLRWIICGLFSCLPNSKSLQNKLEAINELKKALNGEKCDLNPHIETLRNGELGKMLRSAIKRGEADNIVDGTKVRTVREFIAALQPDQAVEERPEVVVRK